jgi:hypothetical protein
VVRIPQTLVLKSNKLFAFWSLVPQFHCQIYCCSHRNSAVTCWRYFIISTSLHWLVYSQELVIALTLCLQLVLLLYTYHSGVKPLDCAGLTGIVLQYVCALGICQLCNFTQHHEALVSCIRHAVQILVWAFIFLLSSHCLLREIMPFFFHRCILYCKNLCKKYSFPEIIFCTYFK